jgi:hypothetical protein
MLTLHVAALRSEVHTLRRHVEALLDDVRPPNWAVITVCCAVLADCIASAPPDLREDLLGIVNDVLRIAGGVAH